MAPKCPPSQTVAVCGLNTSVSKEEVVSLVEKYAGKSLSTSCSEPIKDKSDSERKIVFVKCISVEAAAKVCQALHEREDKNLGVAAVKFKLQAVKKNALSGVDWSKFSSKEIKTLEGKIARKRKADCFIEEPLKVSVLKTSFEGSDAEWAALKVGDVLRVEAEEDNDTTGQWKATEAALVKPSPAGKAAAKQAATDAVLQDAIRKVEEVLTANLKGKGWVSLATIGGWFNGTQDVKDALSIVKTKHKQLKNFAVASPLVAVKQEGGDFKICLEADVSRSRTAAEEIENQKARAAAMESDIKTADETPEEREGRMRSFRAMCGIMELAPRILHASFRKAWQMKRGSVWSDKSGSELESIIKNKQDFKQRLGAKVMEKIGKSKIEEWDISLVSKLLLEDPGLLKDVTEAKKAVEDVRKNRNEFVHEFPATLTQPVFDEFWKTVMTTLAKLADFCGSETQQLLEREQSKILNSQTIDHKKESQFNAEAERVKKELEGLKDKVSEMSSDMQSMKKKMITESVMDRKIAELAAAQSQSGSGSGNREVKLDGHVYTWHSSDRLAGGAQGSVFKAVRKDGGTTIALKLAEHTTSRNDREHENLMKLRHPNVVRYIGHSVVEIGPEKKELIIGMELVVGMSYDKYLEDKGPLKWDDAAKDFTQLIEGMAAVHAQGILHRDLKPANLMRKKNGRIVIVDFGLSKSYSNMMTGTQTSVGTFQGTVAYSAPEQHGKEATCLASDVFGMAVILYEAITGEVPFGTSSDSTSNSSRTTVAGLSDQMSVALFLVSLSRQPPAPFEPGEAPPSINDFVMRCLEKQAANRFKDAGAMKEPWQAALDQAEAGREASPAQRFWRATWGDREEILPAEFKAVFEKPPFSLPPAALAQLVSQCDADDNGRISLEEFQDACDARDPMEVAKEAAAKASGDPDGVYFKTDLVTSDVRYTSKGDWLGGKKDRIGSMTMKKGRVEVHRRENGKMDYGFDMLKTSLKALDDSSIELCCEKPRKFVFKSQADFSAFKAGFEKTKAWLEADE